MVVQKLTTQKLTHFTEFLDIRKIGENMKKFIDTLVRLKLGMASVARFLKFPIFMKIDVF